MLNNKNPILDRIPCLRTDDFSTPSKHSEMIMKWPTPSRRLKVLDNKIKVEKTKMKHA